jgi:SNF2 family DNA or RNA helicase
VHDQCTGRVFRDGQQHPVFAFYLMADVGIDPVIADTLGVKEAQSHGILNPNADMVELLDSSSGGQSKKLAAAYLAQLGEAVPDNAAEERQGAA